MRADPQYMTPPMRGHSNNTLQSWTRDISPKWRPQVLSKNIDSLRPSFGLSVSRPKVSSAKIAHMTRDEAKELLEQLDWEPAVNVSYTLLEKKSIQNELEEQKRRPDMNDNSNSCVDLSQKNKTELQNLGKSPLSVPTTRRCRRCANHANNKF